MKKEPKFRRNYPDALRDLLDLLNEVPRTDEDAEAFLDRYEVAVQGTAFIEFEKHDHPRIVQFIGQADRSYAAERLEELREDRSRLLTIISVFNDRIRPLPKIKWMASAVNSLSVKLGVPITKIGFTHKGSITLRQSPALTVLMSEQNAFALLERLSVCPICQSIKWLKKIARSDTCGEQQCRDHLAYVRKSHRVGRVLNDVDQKIFDQVGAGRRYKTQVKKTI